MFIKGLLLESYYVNLVTDVCGCKQKSFSLLGRLYPLTAHQVLADTIICVNTNCIPYHGNINNYKQILYYHFLFLFVEVIFVNLEALKTSLCRTF